MSSNTLIAVSSMSLRLRVVLIGAAFLAAMLAQRGAAQNRELQQGSSNCANGATIEGNVVDSKEEVVSGASVHLSGGAIAGHIDTVSDQSGKFIFADRPVGSYRVAATKQGLASFFDLQIAERDCIKTINLVLLQRTQATANRTMKKPESQEMEFADDPKFTIAGVTDWTAIGGHGSDSMLRTSESLASQTARLKSQGAEDAPAAKQPVSKDIQAEALLRESVSSQPESFSANSSLGKLYADEGRYADAMPYLAKAYKLDPANKANDDELGMVCSKYENPQQASAQLHELLKERQSAKLNEMAAELDEQTGDTLAAAQEFATASRLDPSEQSYFEWGSDLLLHRAIWQSLEVFHSGMKLYPQSIRLQTATAAALFAGARYQEAARLLCAVTDQHPDDNEAYLFLGEMQLAAPIALPCVESKLERFVQQDAKNAVANYLYAMAMFKQDQSLSNPYDRKKIKGFLTKAVSLDPKYGAAYLQLGIIAASENDYPKAIEWFQRSIQVEPRVPDAYYRLAVAYDRTLQKDKAKEEFRLHDQVQQEQQRDVQQQRLQVKQFLFREPTVATTVPCTGNVSDCSR